MKHGWACVDKPRNGVALESFHGAAVGGQGAFRLLIDVDCSICSFIRNTSVACVSAACVTLFFRIESCLSLCGYGLCFD